MQKNSNSKTKKEKSHKTKNDYEQGIELKKLIVTMGLLAMLGASSLLQTGCQQDYSGIPKENGTIEILFSKTDNCSARLEELVANAKEVKAALYDLDEPRLIQLLKEKNADLLVDEDNYFGLGQKISGEGLMHNKFWILYKRSANIDNENTATDDYIITGSMNPTKNDIYKNDNNLVIINGSEYLKKNYEAEFAELKNNLKDTPTKYTKVNLSGILIENYFCPDDGCENHVLATLKSAKESIYFMTFSFTSDPLGNYLVLMKDKLDIQGVFDKSQVSSQKQYTEYYKMLDKSMNVRLDGNPDKLHHKVFIVDKKIVITGSYNPTGAGTSTNDENILIIYDSGIAQKYFKEFQRVWEVAGGK